MVTRPPRRILPPKRRTNLLGFSPQLEELLNKLCARNVPKDLSHPQYRQAYPLIKQELDDIRELISSNRHHDDLLCYAHIINYIYLLKWLPKEERREYMVV